MGYTIKFYARNGGGKREGENDEWKFLSRLLKVSKVSKDGAKKSGKGKEKGNRWREGAQTDKGHRDHFARLREWSISIFISKRENPV